MSKKLFFSILIGIYVLLHFSVPAIFQYIFDSKYIENFVAQKYNINLTISKPALKLGWQPYIYIQADEIILNNDKKAQSEFRTNLSDLKLKVRLLPLLTGKVHVNYLYLNEFNSQIHIKDAQPINFNNFKLNNTIYISKAKIDVEKYLIEIRHLNNPSNTVFINGNSFNLSKLSRNYLDLATNANIITKKNKSDIIVKIKTTSKYAEPVIDFKINDFNLNVLNIFKDFISKDIIATEGIVNLSAKNSSKNFSEIDINGNVKNLKILMSDNIKNIIAPDNVSIFGNLSLKNGIDINSLKMTGKGIDASIDGRFTPKKIEYLDIKLKNTRSEDLVKLLPFIKTNEHDINIYALKKYPFYSNINGSVIVSGDYKKPNINGSVSIEDAYLIKPMPNNTPNANILINLLGKKMSLDIKVPAPDNQLVTVTGTTDIYPERNCDLDINSTENVDLELVSFLLYPIHEVFNFKLGPVPIMNIKGYGGINLIAKGNQKDPHLWGKFYYKNSQASFIGINNFELKDSDGELVFDDTIAKFKTLKGNINSKPVSISGTCILDGTLDFDVIMNNQAVSNFHKSLLTSPLLANFAKPAQLVNSINGTADIIAKVVGKLPDIKTLELGKNIFITAETDVKNVTIYTPFAEISKIDGKLILNKNNAEFNFSTTQGNSSIFVNGKTDFNSINMNFNSDLIKFKDINLFLTNQFYRNILSDIKDTTDLQFNLNGTYKGPIENIDLKNITFKSALIPTKSSKNIIIKNGEISFNNNVLNLSRINGTIKNKPININLQINNPLSNKTSINGEFDLNQIDINTIFLLKNLRIIDKNYKDFINNFKNLSGTITLKGKVRNNQIYSTITPQNIAVTYSDIPIKLIGGNLATNGNALILRKINLVADMVPILLDGKISNLLKNPYLQLYINTKPTQKFLDKNINQYAIYPVKLKGDVILSSYLTGTKSNLNVKTNAKLEKDSSIYYMGASIGDTENPVVLNSDITFEGKNTVKINQFSYDKLIASLNNKQYRTPQINASGMIKYTENDVFFKDFKIKTDNSTDAKIFNLIFKKPSIKSGLFTSNITINGWLTSPKIIGTFNISALTIPHMNTIIKELKLKFNPINIQLDGSGEFMASPVSINANLHNKLTIPYHAKNIDLKFETINFNKLFDFIRHKELESHIKETKNTFLTVSESKTVPLVVDKLNLTGQNITVKNINATDLTATGFTENKSILNVSNYKFNIAEGTVQGNLKFNLNNKNTKLKLTANQVNANIISDALFEISNQMYGMMDGTFDLNCNGTSNETCMESLSGNGRFVVKNGKMPKLGSLEYLIKAANTFKSGITGLSINSILDLLTPMLKNGEFDTITGEMNISNGNAESFIISTQSKYLNLFMSGKYYISSSTADAQIFGRLSKKVDNILGPIGNLSINTIFNCIPRTDLNNSDNYILNEINKIPGFDFSDENYRLFNVIIDGNLNSDNFVKSFSWLN